MSKSICIRDVDISLDIRIDGIYIIGNVYKIKDILKEHGAKWNLITKNWYFSKHLPDISFLTPENPNWICCYFASNINYDKQNCECIVNCKKYNDILNVKEFHKRIEEQNIKHTKTIIEQKKEFNNKYLLLFACRDMGETDIYFMEFNNLEECYKYKNQCKKYINKRRHTPFEHEGTLYDMFIEYNNDRLDVIENNEGVIEYTISKSFNYYQDQYYTKIDKRNLENYTLDTYGKSLGFQLLNGIKLKQ